MCGSECVGSAKSDVLHDMTIVGAAQPNNGNHSQKCSKVYLVRWSNCVGQEDEFDWLDAFDLDDCFDSLDEDLDGEAVNGVRTGCCVPLPAAACCCLLLLATACCYLLLLAAASCCDCALGGCVLQFIGHIQRGHLLRPSTQAPWCAWTQQTTWHLMLQAKSNHTQLSKCNTLIALPRCST